MLPLIPIATALLPEIAKFLFGDKGEKTAEAVVGVVQTITGTADVDQANEMLRDDPKLAAQVRVELARIVAEQEAAQRAAQVEALKVEMANVANARQTVVDLARVGSITHYAPAILSLVVLGMFGVMTYFVVTQGLPQESREQANILLGTLGAMAGAAVNFWLGSSIGSIVKTNILAAENRSNRNG